MNNYYKEIEHLIIKNETNKKARIYQNNNEDLETKWNIGKLLVEAQGGESRAKYGNGLIKEWSKDFTEKYGNGYSITNLKRYRQFYIAFQKGAPVAHQLTWSHYIILLPLKNENERNYYINLCITHNLSKRELIKEIKSNSYDRLLEKPKKIDIGVFLYKGIEKILKQWYNINVFLDFFDYQAYLFSHYLYLYLQLLYYNYY